MSDLLIQKHQVDHMTATLLQQVAVLSMQDILILLVLIKKGLLTLEEIDEMMKKIQQTSQSVMLSGSTLTLRDFVQKILVNTQSETSSEVSHG